MLQLAGQAVTRYDELRKALEEADICDRDYRILAALLYRADWTTGEIPDRFQPKGLAQLARWAHMSRAKLCRGLDNAEQLGWLKRGRYHRAGRGQFTTYQVTAGRSESVSPADSFRAEKSPLVNEKESAASSGAAGQAPVSGVRRSDRRGVVRQVACPLCGKQVTLMPNGAMRMHVLSARSRFEPPDECRGSRRPPLAVVGA